MQTVTIACPTTLEHIHVDSATAPIWVDASGNRYRVASGPLDNIQATEHLVAVPDKITIIIGATGLEALAQMQLKGDNNDETT